MITARLSAGMSLVNNPDGGSTGLSTEERRWRPVSKNAVDRRAVGCHVSNIDGLHDNLQKAAFDDSTAQSWLIPWRG